MSLLSYSAMTTKLRAMESRLLTDDDYVHIASLESIPEFVDFLRNTKGYHDTFTGADTGGLHRGQLEKLLSHSRYDDFAHIYRFAGLRQRRYLDLYFMRIEVTILKSCLRMAFDHQTADVDFSSFIDFFDKHSDINLRLLSACKTVGEIIDNLRGSKYYEPLVKLSELDGLTLFDYETRLDLFYFTTVWKTKDKCLEGADLDIITQVYGTRIDMVNLQWIYRTKKYHNLDSGQIYSFILPFGYKLSRSQLSALIEAGSAEEFLAGYRLTYYGDHPISDKCSLEDIHRDIQLKLAKSTTRSQPYSIAFVNAYLYRKEIEVRRLVSALECIRYKLSASDSLAYILK